MNTKEQGHQYRVTTLRLLARLGYATTRQIARGVWWRCDDSTRRMARRTLSWLVERGYIVARRADDDINQEQLVAVTTKGASWLAEVGEPLPFGKAHARDWLRHAHSHRTACNSVYVAGCGLFPDVSAWTELEIRAGTAPLCSVTYLHDGLAVQKIPDVLFSKADEGLVWVEIENSWRSDKDLEKAISSMRVMAAHGLVNEVHFVITAPGARSIASRLHNRLTHGPASGLAHPVRKLDQLILSRYLKFFTLNPESLVLAPVEL